MPPEPLYLVAAHLGSWLPRAPLLLCALCAKLILLTLLAWLALACLLAASAIRRDGIKGPKARALALWDALARLSTFALPPLAALVCLLVAAGLLAVFLTFGGPMKLVGRLWQTYGPWPLRDRPW